MDREQRDRLQTIVRQMIRQAPPREQTDLRSAVNLLVAARGDAPWLLMNRVWELENALAQAQAQAAAGAAQPAGTAFPPALPAALAGGRSLVRDAAAVATGVVVGGLVLGGLDDLTSGDDLGIDL